MNRCVFTACAALSLLAAAAYAQLTRGFISGTVQDASGAIIAGVQVTITNRATNIQRNTQSNDAGVFRFVAVEPGSYDVEFSKQGFETRRMSNIDVATTQEVVLNPVLAVGATITTLEVQEQAVGVELAKATPTIDRKLDQQLVVDMPTTGATRDINTLALLAPTATRAPGSTGISANGQRARNDNFTIDGVDNNDLSVTLSNARVVPEGVAEFQVQTSSYSAEFGHSTGAQISVITRSGSNAFHGDAFDYYRGNWMDPVNLTNKRFGLTHTPRYNQNQAGGDIGGPIIRNKTFFFGLVQTNRTRTAPDARNAASVTIPTPAGFASLANLPLGPGETTQGRQAALNALGFLNQIYPAISQFSSPTTTTVNGTPVQVSTLRIPIAQPSDFWNALGRVDHQLTTRDTISYRYALDKRTQPNVASNLGFGPLFAGAQALTYQNHALSETHTFSPRLLNEFRFGYARDLLAFPENDPTDTTAQITGFFTIGGAANFPQGRTQNTFQWQDVATYQAGKHSVKFGADIRRNRLFNLAAFDSKGTWVFNNFQDFLNNNAFSLQQAVNQATFDARQTNQYYFAQDDIKLTKDLTVNVGLRYELSGVPFGFFGAATPQIAAAGVPLPVRKDTNNWAPRLGFAYSPSAKSGLAGKLFGDGRTVLRGGYGVAYDVLFYNILTVNASNYPRVVSARTDPPATLNLYPHLAPAQATVPPFNPLATFVNTNTDAQNPATHFYSFAIQREFSRDYIFEIGYTGSRSYHGIRQGDYNPGILTPAQGAAVIAAGNSSSIPTLQQRRVNPAWGDRVTIETTGIANYNALYLRFDKKISHGLLVGANYTWSKNLSDNDESLAVAGLATLSPQVPQNYFNFRNDYSPSGFDRTGRFATYYTYRVPWLSSGLANSAVMRQIFKGWELTGFTEWQSGMPFTILTGVDSLGDGSNQAARPNYNPGGTLTKDPVTGDLRTFTIPLNGTGIVVAPLGANGLPLANTMPFGGNIGKNTFRGPGFSNWNFSAQKIFSVTERLKVRVRADWIDLWNHRNFLPPNNNMSSPAFGTNTSDPGGRTMLLSAKISF